MRVLVLNLHLEKNLAIPLTPKVQGDAVYGLNPKRI